MSTKSINLSELSPETIQAMEDLGVGRTRADKWGLDDIPEGSPSGPVPSYKVIVRKEFPSVNWKGPVLSDSQKASGMRIRVRKTRTGDYMVIRLPNQKVAA